MSVPPPVGGDCAVTEADAGSLGAVVDGVVRVPGDDGYAEECATYNLSLPRRPAVVIGAASPGDVSSAVQFGAARGLPVGVLATGHATSVPADGAVLVTTRRMNAVSIDPVARTARAEAGVRWQQVIEAAAPHGLAPLNGSSPLVGVVGYTLGGGLSPVGARARGWAADHVRAIEMVTADGEPVRTTPQRDADLFWAVRGGKDNFGIVTAIEFGLFEVERLYGGALYFPGELTADVLAAFQECAPTLPEEMTMSVALMRLPPLDIVPEPLRGRLDDLLPAGARRSPRRARHRVDRYRVHPPRGDEHRSVSRNRRPVPGRQHPHGQAPPGREADRGDDVAGTGRADHDGRAAGGGQVVRRALLRVTVILGHEDDPVDVGAQPASAVGCHGEDAIDRWGDTHSTSFAGAG